MTTGALTAGQFAFDHETPAQRIMFGSGGVIDHAVTAVADLGAERVLIIAGGSAAALADQLAERLPVCGRIREAVQHVPADRAEAAIALATELNADLVLTIGGGSAIGLAKMIARDVKLPIIAIPTTFSGSEATKMWGMTTNGRKATGIDPAVLPSVVIYDAELFSSLPAQMVAASGMNAIAHAIDGFWAPGANPITAALGVEGVRSLVPGLRGLASDGDDLAAREKTLYGAYMAATAFASTGSGLHHKICHVLGGSFNMPHAQTHAVVIAYVAAPNEAAVPDIAQQLAPIFGEAKIGHALWQLNKDIGGPKSLAELGFREEDIAEAVDIILPSVPASNPGEITANDLAELLRRAWAGTEPN